MPDGIAKKVTLIFDADYSLASAKDAAFARQIAARQKKYYATQEGSAVAAKARRDSGYGLSTPLATIKEELVRADVERAVLAKRTKQTDTENKKRARVETQGLAQDKKIKDAKLRAEEAYNRSYYRLSQQSRSTQNRADRQALTSANKNAAVQWKDVQQKTAQWAKEDQYKAAVKSGDFRTASRLEAAAVKGGAKPLTPAQRKLAGTRMAGQGGGGYGQYVMAYALGGQAGLIGLSMRQEGYKKLGTGLMVGGAAWKLASGAVGLARRGADLLGLNSDTMQNYMEFDKALKLATNNLRAGLSSSAWAALSPGITDRAKLVDSKLKNAAMSLAAQYGGAGNATDVGNLFRAMSGVGGLRNGVAQDVIDVSRVAMKLAMISEETTPEEAGKGIMAISNAAKAQGINNLSFDQIASAMYKAGALSPLMVSDLTKNAGNIAMSMTGGASLSEALSSYMLLTSAGFSGAKAGTQLASLQLRMPTVLRKKGFGKMLGISDNELANLGPFGFITKLTSQANREGLNTAYGITPGDNPLKSKSLQNDIAAILSDAFGLRGGQLAAFMASTIGDDTARAKFEGWMSQLSDGATLMLDFNNAVRVVSKTTANRMANAQNAIEGIKFSIWEVLSPWIGRAGEVAAIKLEETRIKNAVLTPSQREEANRVLQERKDLLEDPATLQKEQEDAYGGGIYEPFIRLGQMINTFVEGFKITDIESGVKNIGLFINQVAQGLAFLFNVLIGAAQAITALFPKGDYMSVYDALSADPAIGPQKAMTMVNNMTPDRRAAIAAQILADKDKNNGVFTGDESLFGLIGKYAINGLRVPGSLLGISDPPALGGENARMKESQLLETMGQLRLEAGKLEVNIKVNGQSVGTVTTTPGTNTKFDANAPVTDWLGNPVL